jgi:hypothetical protein
LSSKSSVKKLSKKDKVKSGVITVSAAEKYSSANLPESKDISEKLQRIREERLARLLSSEVRISI